MNKENPKNSEKTSKKYVALAKVRAPTGISIYYPLTTTSAPNYPLPPPTTLVGALAYPYLRTKIFVELVEDSENVYSPAILILDKVIYATAGAEGWTVSKDAERVYQLIYQRKDRWKSLEYAYSVGVRGSVYYLHDKLYLLYILTDKELTNYIYGITRIGRKESLVSIEDVIVEELEKTIKAVGSGTFETYFYLPEEIATCVNSEIIALPKLTKENLGRATSPIVERYHLSKGLGPIRGNLKSSGALLEVDGFEIPVPKHLVS